MNERFETIPALFEGSCFGELGRAPLQLLLQVRAMSFRHNNCFFPRRLGLGTGQLGFVLQQGHLFSRFNPIVHPKRPGGKVDCATQASAG